MAVVALLALLPVAMDDDGSRLRCPRRGGVAALIAYEALRYSYARSWIRGHRGAFTTDEVRDIAPRTGRHP